MLELLGRNDLLLALNTFILEDSVVAEAAASYKMMHAEIAFETLKTLVNPSLVAPAAFVVPNTVTIYTPAGTAVSAYIDHNIYLHLLINSSLSDADERVADAIAAQEEYYTAYYPSAVKIEDYDPRCNCHSYALYGEGNMNRYWINNPAAFYTDGSFIRVSDSHCPQYALYYDGGVEPEGEAAYYVHTAIRSGEDRYYSKWGFYGAYRHTKVQNPYYTESTGVSYWRLNIIYADSFDGGELQ